MRLLIDDVRTNISADIIARTYNEGIQALKENRITTLYLDHDLGEEHSGYDIMCWLENNQRYLPKEIICVSANPVGARRI